MVTSNAVTHIMLIKIEWGCELICTITMVFKGITHICRDSHILLLL